MADMASSSLIPISLSYIATDFLVGHLASQLTTVFVFFFPQFSLRAEVMRVISGSDLLAEYGCNGRSWSNCFGP